MRTLHTVSTNSSLLLSPVSNSTAMRFRKTNITVDGSCRQLVRGVEVGNVSRCYGIDELALISTFHNCHGNNGLMEWPDRNQTYTGAANGACIILRHTGPSVPYASIRIITVVQCSGGERDPGSGGPQRQGGSERPAIIALAPITLHWLQSKLASLTSSRSFLLVAVLQR